MLDLGIDLWEWFQYDVLLKEVHSRQMTAADRRKGWHYKNQCPAQHGEGKPTGCGEEALTA